MASSSRTPTLPVSPKPARLIASETRRKTVRQVHSYLSAYGTHGPVQPSAGDTKSGFLLAFAAMRTVLESEKGT